MFYRFYFIALFLSFFYGSSQNAKTVDKEIHYTAKEATKAILRFQKELNKEYKNPKESPLRNHFLKNFKKHPFFAIDMKYRVIGKLKITENAPSFEFPTSSGKTKTYKEYGKIYFRIDDQDLVLTVYQNLKLIKEKEYEDYLFLPFQDATNGKTTYGGGKYLDLRIPKNENLVLDFNQSYHPYCAYNPYDYSCPVVPAENRLPIEIKAGIRYEDIYLH